MEVLNVCDHGELQPRGQPQRQEREIFEGDARISIVAAAPIVAKSVDLIEVTLRRFGVISHSQTFRGSQIVDKLNYYRLNQFVPICSW